MLSLGHGRTKETKYSHILKTSSFCLLIIKLTVNRKQFRLVKSLVSIIVFLSELTHMWKNVGWRFEGIAEPKVIAKDRSSLERGIPGMWKYQCSFLLTRCIRHRTTHKQLVLLLKCDGKTLMMLIGNRSTGAFGARKAPPPLHSTYWMEQYNRKGFCWAVFYFRNAIELFWCVLRVAQSKTLHNIQL